MIWFNRNRVVFRGALPNVSQMLSHVKGLSWGWRANRVGNQIHIDFKGWNNNIHLLV